MGFASCKPADTLVLMLILVMQISLVIDKGKQYPN